MNSRRLVYGITLGGVLTALTVLLQLAPLLLPGLGLVLSPFGTLPIAIAAAYHPLVGVLTLVTSGFIAAGFNPTEAVGLLLTSGPLGIALGLTGRGRGLVGPTLGGGAVLTAGILCLNNLLGIPAFGGARQLFPWLGAAGAYLLFALIYAFAWARVVRRVIGQLDGNPTLRFRA